MRIKSAVEVLSLELESSPELYDIFRRIVEAKVRVIYSTKMYNVPTLVHMYKSGELYVDPDLKREYTWSIVKASRFIESLILGLPIPPIFVIYLHDRGLVVDGFHRLETLRLFYSNELKLRGIVLRELEDKVYTELDENLRNRLDRTAIPVVEVHVEPPDPSTTMFVVYEIFRRLNLGAKPLTTLQVIFCGLPTPAVRAVKELLQDENMQTLLNPRLSETRNMMDRYLVLMLMVCIYWNRLMNLTSGGKVAHARAIARFLRASEEEVAKVKERVKELAELALRIGLSRRYFLLTTYGLSRRYTIISSTLFLVIMYLIHELELHLGKDVLIEHRSTVLHSIERFFRETTRKFVIDDREVDLKTLIAYISRQGGDKLLHVLYNTFKQHVLHSLSSEEKDLKDSFKNSL